MRKCGDRYEDDIKIIRPKKIDYEYTVTRAHLINSYAFINFILKILQNSAFTFFSAYCHEIFSLMSILESYYEFVTYKNVSVGDYKPENLCDAF